MDRAKLYPRIGSLYPAGTMRLAEADDIEAVKTIANDYEVVLFFFWSLFFVLLLS